MDKKPKVLIVVRSFPPIQQGDAINYGVLGQEIGKAQDLSMVILTSYLSGARVIEKSNRSTIYRMLLTRSSIHYDKSISVFNRYLFYLLGQLSLFILIPFFLFVFRINTIHFQTNIVVLRYGKYQNWILQLLLRLLPCKVILDARGVGGVPKKDWPFDKIVYNSRETYSRMRAGGIDTGKCVYIPSPIFLAEQEQRSLSSVLEKHTPYICFIGRVTADKGIYTLLEAFSLPSEVLSRYNLVIAGPNSDGDSFRNSIKDNHRILYLGMLPHADALDVIKHSDLLVLPSRAEGVPRVCLEAIMMGKKIVAPPSIREFDTYCPEFVLEEITSSKVAHKIEEIISGCKTPNYPPLKEMTRQSYVKRMKDLYISMVQCSP